MRDADLSYMDYTEQITFLFFVKMTRKRTTAPNNGKPIVPPALDQLSSIAGELKG